MSVLAAYDAAIIGAGPAGVATAIGLARSGARVLLLERSPTPVDKPGEVVASSVRPLLAGLGIDGALTSLRSHPLAGRLICWNDAKGYEIGSVLDLYGGGIVVRRAEFEGWLLEVARAAGVCVLCGVDVLDVDTIDHNWCIKFRRTGAPGAVICSTRVPLIVEATGRGPGVLKYGQRQRSNRFVSLVARYPGGANVFDHRLFVEATETGWWYGILLPDGHVVIATLTDLNQLPRGGARRAWWTAELRRTEHIARLVDRQSSVPTIRGFAADTSIRTRLSGDGWVAVGEAAAAYDPLTGQGIAVAIAKGAALARLVATRRQSAAIADYVAAERDTFEAYEAQRNAIYREAAGRFSSAFWDRWK